MGIQMWQPHFYLNAPGHTNFRSTADTHQNLFNVLKPASLIDGKYEKLTDKVYAAFKGVYLHNEGYQWYLKADDDTFIFMENLRRF